MFCEAFNLKKNAVVTTCIRYCKFVLLFRYSMPSQSFFVLLPLLLSLLFCFFFCKHACFEKVCKRYENGHQIIFSLKVK